MKKILATFLILFSSLVYSNDLEQNKVVITTSQAVDLKVDVKNDYFYFGYNASPFISLPEVGYRYQDNQLGFDVNFGATGKNKEFVVANLGASLLVFPCPDLTSQFFLGFEIAGGLEARKAAKWENYFTLYPTVFVGKDYTFSNGHKIFAQITFIPGVYKFNSSNWNWLATPGFKFGYGF